MEIRRPSAPTPASSGLRRDRARMTVAGLVVLSACVLVPAGGVRAADRSADAPVDSPDAAAGSRAGMRERAPSVVGDRVAASAGARVDGVAAADAITTEYDFRRAWADYRNRRIDLGADIYLRNCQVGDPIRESPMPILVDGHGFGIRQTCFEERVLRQDGTGFVKLVDVRLSRGGSDGPGAALTSRGEIVLVHCEIRQNLAEEPGGAVFSMRRITVRHSILTGNLANDDGGALYARRGGVQVYDSNVSNNLVDGSGGAIGSTGDILVVRSNVNGNTTDGDGGAIYADEDADVTVVDSTVNGSDADGPGGAIWTLDGDIAIFGSELNGNRADDRGGAIGGESDVLIVNSTIARNLASAHVGGGVWARGDLVLVNATVTDNIAEGSGGGVIAAGRVVLVGSTVIDNVAPNASNLAAGNGVDAYLSVIGPPGTGGEAPPSQRNCEIVGGVTSQYGWVSDTSCRMADPTDRVAAGDPLLGALELSPTGRVRLPGLGSPVVDAGPSACARDVTPPGGTGFLLDVAQGPWADALAGDALGVGRPQGDLCDIGAVEVGVP